MKKVLKLIFLVAMLMTLALTVTACRRDGNDAEEGMRIALIAHSDDSILDDGSFNQGAWDGIRRFVAEHGLTDADYQFFQPHAGTDDARIALIEHAIDLGFNVLVLPGFHFVTSLYTAQDYFPDVYFILLDATPASNPANPATQRIEANVAAIHYAEAESGFLAGYAAVMEGFRTLGFTGGNPVPAVARFGHGFIQGAEHAAASLGLAAGDVTIAYHYFGAFAPSPEAQTLAASWFATGIEVIFAAAGGANGSVAAATLGTDGWMIGVDVDQYWMSERVISSAMKELALSVYDMLTDILNDRFVGGREIMFDATNNGIGLPMHSSRWENFTQEQYDAIFAQLANGTVVPNPSLNFDEILADINLVTVTLH